MLRNLTLCAMFFFLVISARAESLSENDKMSFQSIITGQIEAFRADDGRRAYDYAAPMIRKTFPTPEHFMAMVKRGYPQVYRPQSFKFGVAGPDAAGHPTQHLTIVGPDGYTYEAIYTMERQPDGTWQINGCKLLKIPGLSA